MRGFDNSRGEEKNAAARDRRAKRSRTTFPWIDFGALVARHNQSRGPAATSASALEPIKNMSSVLCRTAVVPARASVAPRAAEARAAVTSTATRPTTRTAVTFPSARVIRDVSVRMGRKGMLADLMDDGNDAAGDPIAKVVTKCPCGSGKEYATCCQPHHDGTATAEALTPEAIVRARFSAYVKNVPKYIVASTHPDSKDMRRKDDPAEAREQLEKDAEATMKKVNFTSLRVKATKEGDGETFVTYEVSYKGAGKKNRGGIKTLAERSRYKKADGEFKYFDALPLNSSSDMNAVGQI